jgi:hypothetical protein
VDRLGAHSPDVSPVDEEDLVADLEARRRGGELGRHLPEDDAPVASRLGQYGADRAGGGTACASE